MGCFFLYSARVPEPSFFVDLTSIGKIIFTFITLSNLPGENEFSMSDGRDQYRRGQV